MGRTFPAVFVEGARHADEAVLAGSRSAKECYFIVTHTLPSSTTHRDTHIPPVAALLTGSNSDFYWHKNTTSQG